MRARCGGGAAAWVAGVLAAQGTQGELAARAAGNIVLLKGMATSIGQWSPVFLLGKAPSLTEKPGRPQSTGLQRVGHNLRDPSRIDARPFFACGSSAPVRVECEGGAAAWLAGPWQYQGCRDTDCLCRGSYGPIRVFLRASCS